MFYLTSCEKNDPIGPKDFPPVLSNLAIPDTIFTGINQSFIFSVKCNDENGLDDIVGVIFIITTNVGQYMVSGSMYDDGNYEGHGDNVPGDGKYSVRLKLDLVIGEYRFMAQAVDQARLRSNELSEAFYAVPGKINLAPIIAKYHIPDTVFVDAIVPFYLSVHASDPDSGDFISKVAYQILGPKITELAEDGTLNDNGTNGDSLAGDGIFSFKTTTEFANWKFGEYHVMIVAFDSQNKSSNSIYEILPGAKMNIGKAPQIMSVSAPDTIQLPAAGDKNFLLTVTVTDQDDNRDIKEVLFNSFKPDGSPSSGNPFKMYDDGTSGDAIAGDYIFSLRIFITSQNATGNYRFEFQAKDYSELSSEIFVHTITVIK